MRKNLTLFTVALFLILGTTAFSKDSDTLISVLEKSQSEGLSGVLAIEEHESGNGNPQNGLMVQVKVGLGVKAAPLYKGKLDVFMKDGVLSAVTKSGLPEVKIYQQGEKRLLSQVYSKSAVDADQTADLLTKALDFTGLVAEIKSGSRVRVKEVDGGKEYRVTIDEKFFETEKEVPQLGQFGVVMQGHELFAESVLEGVLVVKTDSNDGLKSLNFEVQYNDPMSGVFEQAMKGGGRIQMKPGDFNKSEKPGRKVTVLLTTGVGSSAAESYAEKAGQRIE